MPLFFFVYLFDCCWFVLFSLSFLFADKIKPVLGLNQKYGLNEVHSYIWNYDGFNNEYKIDTVSHLSLMDSSCAGQSGIRSELVPTLLKFYNENKNSQNGVGIFEIGRVVTGLDENNLVDEEKRLAVVFASQTQTKEELFEQMMKEREENKKIFKKS